MSSTTDGPTGAQPPIPATLWNMHDGRRERPREPRRTNGETGRWGEDAAARYLVAAGLTILDRNWRCDVGELDIVAREGAAIAFVEVKTRSSTAYGDPAEAVEFRKARRIRWLAVRWLREHPGLHARDLRFDVVAILCPPHAEPSLRHVRAAF